ncbi:MAG: hypothetical protein ACI81O_002191, partial [Cyclobacteriaceae bacterium]
MNNQRIRVRSSSGPYCFLKQYRRTRSIFSALACAIVLVSCGGGGEGSAESIGFSAAPGAPPQTTVLITGAATKGPIRGASVALFAMNEFGFAQGAALATTTTDGTGNFSVSLPTGTGLVLVETRGGSFIDESDQEPNPALKRQLSLTAAQGFLSVLPAGATTVAITPFTQALLEKVRLESQAGGFSTRFATSAAAFNAIIGFDVLTTIPANPLLSAANTSANSGQYALLLGGIANVINNTSIQLNSATPTFEIINAVIRDLTDGTIDGKRFNAPVSL